jgi:hypothetical protein
MSSSTRLPIRPRVDSRELRTYNATIWVSADSESHGWPSDTRSRQQGYWSLIVAATPAVDLEEEP